MWSHGDWGVTSAHSAIFEESKAQAESGTKAAVKTLNASPRISTLRIKFQSSTLGFMHALQQYSRAR